MSKKPRFLLLIIILLTLGAIYLDIPKLTLFGKSVTHPQIKFGGYFNNLEPKLGLDLAGGVQLTMSADMTGIDPADQAAAIESAKNIVENRINSLGVAEPVIQTAKTPGQYRLVVEIPGISDIDQAIAMVKRAAHLEFKILKPEISPESSAAASLDNYIASGLTGSDLKRAVPQASKDPNTPGYVVSLEFNGEGTKKLAQITQDNLGKPMPMFLDNQPISWPPPVIRAVIIDGNAQVSGNFDAKGAKQLAIQLNAGALPAPLKIESQTRVGPTIGAEAIQKSLFATVVGLISVAVFMIAYYRFLGIFAVIALAIYTILVFAIFKLFQVTLTLAGIAGFVLSIGMAVDANILIFERMKEEKRWGKPNIDALFAGFDRAWSSIRDSNASSLITTAILYQFGTGPIKGFAFTLAIGIFVSLFSAITVTKTLLRVFYVRSIK